MDKIGCLKDIANNSSVFVQNGDWYRIVYCTHESFHARDEDSCEEYEFRYDEIDLEKDKFYELKEVDFSEYLILGRN